MDTEQLEVLRRKYEFDSWESSDLMARGDAPPKDVVAGFDPASARQIDPGDGSRLIRASWSPPGEEGAMLVMDMRVCPDSGAARQVLLELLGNMQAPDIARLSRSIGDVAFGRSTETLTAVAFARGNVVVWLRNGGDKVLTVDDVAAQIDDWLSSSKP